MVELTDAQLNKAEALGRKTSATEPRAINAQYDHKAGRIAVDLDDGCAYAFPVERVQELRGADAAGLADVVVDGAGFNLHWPRLGVDLYVPALVSGIFGTRAWMAGALARAAGRTKSPTKAAAARANGMKGGRPKKAAGA